MEVIVDGGTALLPEIEHRLDELDRLIREAPDRERRAELQAEQASLLDLRDEKRGEAPVVEYRQVGTDNTIAEDYEAATTVAERRAVLDFALQRVLVSRGRTGRRTRESLVARLDFQFQVGQYEPPSDEGMARLGRGRLEAANLLRLLAQARQGRTGPGRALPIERPNASLFA